MIRKFLSLTTGAVALLCLAGAGFAQDAKQPSGAELAQQQAKVKAATSVIAIGRAEKDPMMLLVGARLLAGLGSAVADPAAQDASKVFDVSVILDEAKALAGDDQYLLDKIAAVTVPRPVRSGERYCGWDYDCPYGEQGCNWIYSCDW